MTQLLSDRRTKLLKIGPFLGATAILVFVVVGHAILPPPTQAPPVQLPLPAWFGILFNLAALSIWGTALYAGWKLKTIQVDGDVLTIGGLRREITVPLHQVAEVGSVAFGRFARIELHGETEFGSSIWFVPTRGDEGFLRPARAVLELRTLVGHRMGDRSATPPAPTDFVASWSRLRRWRIARAASFILPFAALPFLSTLFPSGPSVGVPPALLLFLPVGLTWIISGNVIQRWSCPQCGQRFFATRWGFPLPAFLTRACRHCGLPKGQAHPSGRRADHRPFGGSEGPNVL
ncbi:MAG: hypothetical protein ABJB33_04350 [Gemmatimonadota bacterium]